MGGKTFYHNRENTPLNIKTVDGKVMPSATELEEAVLGAVLLERHCLNEVIADFTELIFYKEQNKLIARAIIAMFREDAEIDLLTVTDRLKKEGKLEQVGGAHYVVTLTNRVASTANIGYHIKILQQKYLERFLVATCTETISKVLNFNEDTFDVYAELQVKLDEAIKDVLHYDIESVAKIHARVISDALEANQRGGNSGVSTGMRQLDNLTNGWQKTDLIIVAGRPGMGKTAFAISLAVNAAMKNEAVGVFSLEMSSEQLVGRIQSIMSEVDSSRIIKKQLTRDEIHFVDRQCQRLSDVPLFIDDTANISLMELKSKARKLVLEKGCKLIVVDYLQLMRSGLNLMSREQEVAEISKGLKSLAKELNVPIIALSQLSRAVESRTDKKPMLADLRESGSLEQDADMVIFCWRPEYYGIESYELAGNNYPSNGLFMALIEKHRAGEVGEIPLAFIAQQTKVQTYGLNSDTQQRPAPITQNNEGFLNEKPAEKVEQSTDIFGKSFEDGEALF